MVTIHHSPKRRGIDQCGRGVRRPLLSSLLPAFSLFLHMNFTASLSDFRCLLLPAAHGHCWSATASCCCYSLHCTSNHWTEQTPEEKNTKVVTVDALWSAFHSSIWTCTEIKRAPLVDPEERTYYSGL